jgi:hypothetical protein
LRLTNRRWPGELQSRFPEPKPKLQRSTRFFVFGRGGRWQRLEYMMLASQSREIELIFEFVTPVGTFFLWKTRAWISIANRNYVGSILNRT